MAGERCSPVTELGPGAASELVALNGAAYPLTAAPAVEQVAAELAVPDVMTLGYANRRRVAGWSPRRAYGSTRMTAG